MDKKICAKCHEEKDARDFYCNPRMKSGLSSYCKACNRPRGYVKKETKERKRKPGKYTAMVKVAIDVFWRQNKRPPTLREISEITGIKSTSVCSYVIKKQVKSIRIEKGRIIPLWVDELFDHLDTQREA